MGILSLFCFAISNFRFVYTNTKVFLFLNWNLFLAFVPWAVSSLMMLHPKLRQSKWMFALLLCTWLLFFPNAPYILTDLFHLHISSAMPVWFDLVLILSFAWTGLLFGFLSLWDIEDLMRKRLKEKYVVCISMMLLFISDAFFASILTFSSIELSCSNISWTAQSCAYTLSTSVRAIAPCSNPKASSC